MPVAVKLSPYFSALGEVARASSTTPAPMRWCCSTGCLLPDIDTERLAVLPRVNAVEPR